MNKVVLTHREQRNSFQFIGPLEAKIEAIWLLTMSGHARQLLIKKKKLHENDPLVHYSEDSKSSLIWLDRKEQL